MLPSDPFILLSVINTKLRDEYSSLDNLCSSLGIDRKDLDDRLRAVGFEYKPQINQFR